jgi:hypothetical protein
MTSKEHLLQELENVPEPLVEQVLNFLRFLKSNGLSASPAPLVDRATEQMTDGERLARLNQLFGAWKDQPDLMENFGQIDRERHAYRGRQIDSLDGQEIT